jgi:hypothetical protein
MSRQDLISKKTRLEFREYFVGTTLRQISQEFDAADVPFDSAYIPPEDGQRRSLVEKYYRAVDFSLWRDVRKVLRVYENVLVELEERLSSTLSDSGPSSVVGKRSRWPLVVVDGVARSGG